MQVMLDLALFVPEVGQLGEGGLHFAVVKVQHGLHGAVMVPVGNIEGVGDPGIYAGGLAGLWLFQDPCVAPGDPQLPVPDGRHERPRHRAGHDLMQGMPAGVKRDHRPFAPLLVSVADGDYVRRLDTVGRHDLHQPAVQGHLDGLQFRDAKLQGAHRVAVLELQHAYWNPLSSIDRSYFAQSA